MAVIQKRVFGFLCVSLVFSACTPHGLQINYRNPPAAPQLNVIPPPPPAPPVNPHPSATAAEILAALGTGKLSRPNLKNLFQLIYSEPTQGGILWDEVRRISSTENIQLDEAMLRVAAKPWLRPLLMEAL